MPIESLLSPFSLCVCLLTFLLLSRHIKDLVGNLEAGTQADCSSRHGGASWMWVLWDGGLGGRLNLAAEGCGRERKAGAARTQGRGLLAI